MTHMTMESSIWMLIAFWPTWISSWKHQSLTGWWFQPLWKILVTWDYCSQYMEKYKMFQTTNQDYNGQSIHWNSYIKTDDEGSPRFFWNLQIHWIEKHTWISFWSQTHILYRILVSGTLHCCLQTHVPSIPIHVSIRFHLSIPFLHFLSNVGKTINQPFGNGLHNLINLFMVILGVVYYCFTMFYPHYSTSDKSDGWSSWFAMKTA